MNINKENQLKKKITKNFFFLPQRTSQNWTEGREQRSKFVLSFNNMDNTKMENGNGQCWMIDFALPMDLNYGRNTEIPKQIDCIHARRVIWHWIRGKKIEKQRTRYADSTTSRNKSKIKLEEEWQQQMLYHFSYMNNKNTVQSIRNTWIHIRVKKDISIE